jgi:hypothetical protein
VDKLSKGDYIVKHFETAFAKVGMLISDSDQQTIKKALSIESLDVSNAAQDGSMTDHLPFFTKIIKKTGDLIMVIRNGMMGD